MNEMENRMTSASLEENVQYFTETFDGSSDLVIRRMEICGVPAALITMEGLIDKLTIAQTILNPILAFRSEETDPVKLFDILQRDVLAISDFKTVTDYSTALNLLFNGFALLLLDGCIQILAAGTQGFQFRSISEPQNETTQSGSRESFVEPYLINMGMIRRRIRDPRLKFERLVVGKRSNTNILLCYLRDVASDELVSSVRGKIKSMHLDTVLASGYLAPFLQKSGGFFFRSASRSERPDTVCAKIGEGRVAIIVDGSPSALIVPHLFVENFQSFDDYVNRPFFAFFIRILKYLAFFIALFMPGFYVATTAFHPELLPQPLLLKIAQSEATTPFPAMLEVLIIHIIYEIMREAGLRVPRPLAQAVSIVSALVIGDTAVSSGLIGAPTLMVVAITATASYVTPSLYEPVAVIRLIMIFVGGWMGFWGLMLGVFVVLVNICSETSYGIPFSAPVSPFSRQGMRDVFWRVSWKKLGKRNMKVQDMPGSKLKDSSSGR
ncbi:MAG: spore germination protein [Hydrogeniiclostridium sp.]